VIIQPLEQAIRPALALLPPHMRSREAQQLLLAIGFQESGFKVRRQNNEGPATGFWQFERGGGVRGVLNHYASRRHARKLCEHFEIGPQSWAVWLAFTKEDVLAAGFARLLLWTHPDPLPGLGDVDYAWDYYIDTWRPGKPHRNRWEENYNRSMDLFWDEENSALTDIMAMEGREA
jgi:hypothetical protein